MFHPFIALQTWYLNDVLWYVTLFLLQEKLLALLAWMSTAEEKFDDLGPIAGDLNAIKDQMDHLKDFKNEVGRAIMAALGKPRNCAFQGIG